MMKCLKPKSLLRLVALLVIASAGFVSAQEVEVPATKEEAVKRVQDTLKQIQALQAQTATQQTETMTEPEPNLIVEEVEPATVPVVEEVAKTATKTDAKKDSGRRFPFFPTQTKKDWPANKVSPSISKDAKQNFYKSAMIASPISFRDMLSIMATKKRVADGVSFDDAVEAMMFRANEVNFKYVGVNKLWLDVRAITGDENTPRIEIYQFCDAMVARKILDYSPEFVIFLPCRIALIEDGEGVLWVMTMDWDITWLDYAQNPNSILDKEVREDAVRIRNAIEYIMDGAATGDF